MLGYLLGAYVTSITIGILIVTSLSDSGFAETSKQTIAPATDFVLGAILLLVARVLSGDRGAAMQERRRKKKEEAAEAGKKPNFAQRLLGRGSPRVAFAVGVVLSFPGGSYLAGLTNIAKLDTSNGVQVAVIVAFCVVQLAFLEVPLLGYALAPEKTDEKVVAFRGWIDANGHRMAIRVAAVLGALLIARGIIEVL